MAKLSPFPPAQSFDGNGDPLTNGTVEFYEAGTTTQKDAFTNEAGDVALPNPTTLDAEGRTQVWLGDGAYKIILKDGNGVEVDQRDDITGDLSGEFLGNVANFSVNTTITTAFQNYFIKASGTIALSLLAAADAGEGFSFVVKNVGSGTVTIDPDGSETPITTLSAGEYCFYICDGVNWQVLYISDNAIALGKIQQIAEARILGRADSAGAGNVTELTPAQIRTVADVYSQAESNALAASAYEFTKITTTQSGFTNTSYTDVTSFEDAITCSSGSDVEVKLSISIIQDGVDTATSDIRIMRKIGAGAFSDISGDIALISDQDQNGIRMTVSFTFPDSPATTEEITYKVQAKTSNASSSLTFQPNGTLSTLILDEKR